MTYKEHFRSATDWKEKVLIMEMFHLLMLFRRKNTWHQRDTARYFKVSMALVSENLKIAHAIGLNELDNCTSRDKALKVLKTK